MNKKKKIEQYPSPLRLNLACGDVKIDGFFGVDLIKTPACDLQFDLTTFPWPFEDNSVDEIICAHFFEHLTGLQRIKFMEEVWRILKVDSGIKIICPYYNSIRAIQDPTHVWPPISEHSFLYFNRKWMEDNRLTHYPINFDKCNFDFQYGFDIEQDWNNRSQEARDFAFKYYMNVAKDIHVVLVKKL